MSNPRLVSVRVSPWSERARFALDHHRIEYHREEYMPLFGEPLLRLRTGVWRGPLSVPVLFHNGQVIRDSVDIARYADTIGHGAPLFPAGAEREIASFVERATAILEAGRILSQVRMLDNPSVLLELVPPAVPAPLRPALVPLVRSATAYIGRKYRVAERDPDEARRTIRQHLTALQSALHGRPTFLDGFTFADIAVAVAIGVLSPVKHPAVRVGPALRAAFGQSDLTATFDDLLQWRDRIYAEHRLAPA